MPSCKIKIEAGNVFRFCKAFEDERYCASSLRFQLLLKSSFDLLS